MKPGACSLIKGEITQRCISLQNALGPLEMERSPGGDPSSPGRGHSDPCRLHRGPKSRAMTHHYSRTIMLQGTGVLASVFYAVVGTGPRRLWSEPQLCCVMRGKSPLIGVQSGLGCNSFSVTFSLLPGPH